MPNSRDIQEGASEFTHIIGLALQYTGAAALFAMAIVGTISIDLVLLAYADKHHSNFLTFYIWFSLFSGNNCNHDPMPLLIASPITSLVAIALSFALGVSGVGIGIAIGWGVAFGILLLGLLVDEIAKAIKPADVFELPPGRVYVEPSVNRNAFYQQAPADFFGLPPSPPSPPYVEAPVNKSAFYQKASAPVPSAPAYVAPANDAPPPYDESFLQPAF